MSKRNARPGIFLTAQWRHLVVLNYAIEPDALERYLPPGLELDFWRGTTYISLVAFWFRNTRLFGVPIPFHRNFPEVNLRFYVKRQSPRGERRGVVFLREIAPRRAVAYVARKFYREKYLALPMRASIQSDPQFKDFARRAHFEWRLGTEEYTVEALSCGLPCLPEPESLDEFIIEHYWAYCAGMGADQSCLEYEVEHPRWLVRTAQNARFLGNATLLYGSQFGEALARVPDSAFFADGSQVAVRRGTALRCKMADLANETGELAVGWH